MKIYSLSISKSVDKALLKIPHKIKVRIFRKMNDLCENPYQGKGLEGKWAGYRSVRVWPYRIIYSVHKKQLTIHIVSIGHRQEVYQ